MTDFVVRQVKKWTSQSRLTNLDVVDDIADTKGTLQDMTTNLETEAEKVGLRISANKWDVKLYYTIPSVPTKRK